MRRLRDGQAVSLEVESLDTNLECLVVAVEGVTVPQRRRYARVAVALPVLLTPLDASGAPAGLVRQVARGSGLRFIGISVEDRARLKASWKRASASR